MTMTPPPWTAPPTIQQPRRSLVVALAALSTLLAITSLVLAIVALNRAETRSPYSAAQRAAARSDLCERFKPAMDAVHAETNGPDPGLGRTSLVNGALILDGLATNPALDSRYREAAKSVVLAYENLVVYSTGGTGNPKFNSYVDAVNAAEIALKDLCRD
ncbi:hypothetical protein KV112_15115 [Mycolicibacter sp. MYC123]|uniref:Alanine and proline rich membrane protein n=1 Tax=[Mycobacterium] zoologicum TaxID=2872311 RepID=A0ABU5YNM6_9MYCO|nr:hypothetical protein [Mycolicibacter sp. MYC123]MEB3051054.1 hypothetical protein [Mycolicibacter sp. MYC123]